VAENAAQALDLATLPQVLGRERVPEPVRVDPEADPFPQPLEQLDHRLDLDRLAARPHQQLLRAGIGANPVQVAHQLTAKPAKLAPGRSSAVVEERTASGAAASASVHWVA
jgi:hypothetical protein